MKNATKGTKQGILLLFGLLMWLVLSSEMVMGQPYISTKGGLLNVVEGLADVHSARDMRWEKARPLLQMRHGDELRTHENSRVEVLLNPGSFARLGGESKMRLLNDRLVELSLEMLTGSMEIEAGNMKSIRQIKVMMRGNQFTLVKDGIYRFDVDGSGKLSARVFRGEMHLAATNGKTKTLKKSSVVNIDAGNNALAFAHFDTKQTDGLSQWGIYRAGILAQANRSAAQSYVSTYGLGSYYGYGLLGYGGWYYNPFYGFYTFLPGYNSFYSFFGGYYSPYGYYYPPISGGQAFRSESVRGNHESLSSIWSGSGMSKEGGWSQPSAGVVMSAPSGGGSSRSEASSGNREGRK